VADGGFQAEEGPATLRRLSGRCGLTETKRLIPRSRPSVTLGMLLQMSGEDFKELTWRNDPDMLKMLREVPYIAGDDVLCPALQSTFENPVLVGIASDVKLCFCGCTRRAMFLIARMDCATLPRSRLKGGRRSSPSYSSRSALETTSLNLPASANSSIRASRPLPFGWAKTMRFVSRTALTNRTASFPAIATDLDINFPQGKLIESLGLRLALDCGQGRRLLYEVPEVVLHTHNDGLRLTAPVHDKPLLILLDSLQDLAELGPGSQCRYDFGHGLGCRDGDPLLSILE